jgi:hypothetical protein
MLLPEIGAVLGGRDRAREQRISDAVAFSGKDPQGGPRNGGGHWYADTLARLLLHQADDGTWINAVHRRAR